MASSSACPSFLALCGVHPTSGIGVSNVLSLKGCSSVTARQSNRWAIWSPQMAKLACPGASSPGIAGLSQGLSVGLSQGLSVELSQGLSEGYHRDIRFIRGIPQGYQKVITRLSVGYQSVIRGLAVNYQKVITGFIK